MDPQVRLLDFQCAVDAAVGGKIAAALVHLVGWDVAFWSGCSCFAVHCFERPGELESGLHHPVSEQELNFVGLGFGCVVILWIRSIQLLAPHFRSAITVQTSISSRVLLVHQPVSHGALVAFFVVFCF